VGHMHGTTFPHHTPSFSRRSTTQARVPPLLNYTSTSCEQTTTPQILSRPHTVNSTSNTPPLKQHPAAQATPRRSSNTPPLFPSARRSFNCTTRPTALNSTSICWCSTTCILPPPPLLPRRSTSICCSFPPRCSFLPRLAAQLQAFLLLFPSALPFPPLNYKHERDEPSRRSTTSTSETNLTRIARHPRPASHDTRVPTPASPRARHPRLARHPFTRASHDTCVPFLPLKLQATTTLASHDDTRKPRRHLASRSTTTSTTTTSLSRCSTHTIVPFPLLNYKHDMIRVASRRASPQASSFLSVPRMYIRNE